MKKIFPLSRIFPFFVAAMTILSINHKVAAISGHCMKRESYAEEWQIEESWDFNTCNEKNKESDGDDIFDPIGLVYWESYG